MVDTMDTFWSQLNDKYNSYYDDKPDPFDQFIEEQISSDPGRAELLKVAESGTRLRLNVLFPIGDFLERRFRYLCSGSFGSALVLESGRRRTPLVVKLINCVPAGLYGAMHRAGMQYQDVVREVRCLRVLASLTGGVNTAGVKYKAACFPQIHQVALCDTERSLMYFEAFYSNQAGVNAYRRLEKAILSMEHCGVNVYKMLAHRRFLTSRQAVSIYKQAVIGLVVAERAFQFEHRDLHAANLMVRSTGARTVRFDLGSAQYSLPAFGGEAKIIDFTYARLTAPDTGEQLYKDLNSLFDAKQVYTDDQADFLDGYKDMHRARANRTDWRDFCPGSNLAWIKRFTRECLEQIDKCKPAMVEALNRRVELAQETNGANSKDTLPLKVLKAVGKIQGTRDYFAKLLALTSTCSTTEQFLAALLDEEFNCVVPIKVKQN